MSEDKTKVEETTEEETLEENDNIEQDEDLDEQDSSEDESEEQSDDEDVEEEIDYKTELEEAQGRLAQQNERIAKQDKKIIKLKKKSKDEFGDEIEDDDVDEEDLDAKVDAKLTARMASLKEDVIDDAIDAVSTNADEAKLIRWHFDNSLNITGFSKKEIITNVGFAKAIANKSKIDITNKLISKKIKSINSSGTKSTAGIPSVKSPKVTQYDRQMAERYFKGDIKKWLKYKT